MIELKINILYYNYAFQLGMTEIMISSRLVIIGLISETPDGIQIHDGETNVWHEKVTTIVRTVGHEPPKSLKWLLILGSIIAGLIVLALITTILWMVRTS